LKPTKPLFLEPQRFEIMMKRLLVVSAIAFALCLNIQAQENTDVNKFRQLGTELPDANNYRTASGAPGHDYWQQQADYDMKIILDDANQRVYGEETVTYTNNSPDELRYIWMQLDQNKRALDSDSYKIQGSSIGDKESIKNVMKMEPTFDGGFKMDYVKDASGKDLEHVINKTMMRIDLPGVLKSGGKFVFKIKWWYNINDRMQIGGRSGFEHFEEEDNYLYTIAQFFPRMVVYADNEGWQHKQFLGSGEFTLNFGDYKVAITVPSDHIVASTGVLQNPKEVLTAEQRRRYEKAKTADSPVMIVTEEEARETEKEKASGTKTWVFAAENVRDFGFATSRKFIWDAMGVQVGKNRPMAMSYYPKEGNPLWEQYSTKAVAQTLETYSKHTIDYPYPVAISVHTKWIGMEYPMICFNGGRPEADGTYTERTKYGMISVIIHEVGHNFFPMIINSDERQWTWMDEGLNTFCQYLTEKEWDRNYPVRRGPARNITDYMGGDKSRIVPIMTNSETIKQFGNNAYGKPATALNILRESVMGRELFDYAFKEYSRRWAFRHPAPADLFRTMEDASGVDLDWFWRGWFYTTDHCDIAMKDVKWFQMDTQDPALASEFNKTKDGEKPADISNIRDVDGIPQTRLEGDASIHDFYTQRDIYAVNTLDKQEYEEFTSTLSEEEEAFLKEGKNFYEITFENQGGLVMPVILEFQYDDGTEEIRRIPAEIWQGNNEEVTKVFVTDKVVVQISLDPMLETADCDLTDNYWPARPTPTRFEIFKEKENRGRRGGGGENPMQREQRNSAAEGK
jgi:hypothetical protein